MKKNKYMVRADFDRGWRSGLPETPCGRGSQLANTKIQRKWIPKIIAKHGIKSIADLGAGDLHWISRIDLGCEYQAYDLIVRNDSVIELDILKDSIPAADCLMLMWVINHLSPFHQRKAMRKLLKADCRYLLITYDHRLEPIVNQPCVDSVVIRRDRGINSEIRLIKC